MHLIVGLGNPGSKYLMTRHNIGFMAVDYIHGDNFQSKWKSLYAKGSLAGHAVLLQKPQTYMNLSGEAVRPLMDFYKIEADKLIVIQDDIAMPFGALRLQKNRSTGGHNGIKDIHQKLGSPDYARLKVGVGMPQGKQSVESHVLSNFSKDEQKYLPDLLQDIQVALEDFLSYGLDKAANKNNRKALP